MTDKGKLRFGIAGMTSDHVWGMGDGLVSLPEVELVAAAEPYVELRQQGAKRWGFERTYADAEAMLEREELDAIMVCGDSASKAPIAEAAARRGVHVYQDKPMAATLEQADRILRAVESSGITLMVAYHTAFGGNYGQLRDLVKGAIGKVFLARGVHGHGGPKEFGCSEYFCEWLFDRSKNGGGCFVDEACYVLDTFLDYVGPVAEVSAFTTQMGHRDYLPPDVEDNSVAILRFENGALGVIDAKWGQVGPAPLRTSYHGDRGMLAIGPNGTDLYSTASPTVPEGWSPVEIKARPGPGGGSTPAGLLGWRAPEVPFGGYRGGAEQRYFVSRVLERRPIEGPVSPRFARQVQEVIEAVYRSAESGRAMRLPLV